MRCRHIDEFKLRCILGDGALGQSAVRGKLFLVEALGLYLQEPKMMSGREVPPWMTI
jgi:hypothetical protein